MVVQPGKNKDVKRSENDFLGHVRTRASVVQLAPSAHPRHATQQAQCAAEGLDADEAKKSKPDDCRPRSRGGCEDRGGDRDEDFRPRRLLKHG